MQTTITANTASPKQPTKEEGRRDDDAPGQVLYQV